MSNILKKMQIAALALILVSTLVPSFGSAFAQTAANATTHYADNITQTSANLYGSATFQPVYERFEIRTSNGQVYQVDANNGFGTAYNLQPGTTYSYRYVAYDGSQTCYGDWVDFTTLSSVNPVACHASISWSPSVVNSGQAATESWTVTGADSATGYCTGIDQAEHGIGLGPQSYTFYPTQTMTCTVKAFKGGQLCDSASATVTVNQPQQVCKDTTANNYGQPLPCTYTQKCLDTTANNYGQPLPCTYTQKCLDPNANNYGQPGACTYTQKCLDPNASNYNQPGACTYTQKCLDPNASNYNQTGACTYVQICRDTTANNYGQQGACTYTQRCLDPSASNYNQTGACTYTQICRDTSANNYGQQGACTYTQRCTDPSATNYNQVGSCTYAQRCNDPSATNYGQVGSCTYQQRCLDPNASNYNQIGTCFYPQQRCTDPNASNYNQIGTCVYLSRCSDPNALNYNGSLPCQYPVQQCQAPTVNVSQATNIGSQSATLNAFIDPHGRATSYWFVYAPTGGSGVQTQGPIYTAQNVFSSTYSLQSDTNYSFNVVAQNSCGTTYGQNVMTFRTAQSGGGGTVVVNTPPRVVTTITGSVTGGSCLVLTPSIQPGNPLPGQEFVYSLTYRNNCPFDLRNASLRTYLPNEVSFSATSQPFLTRDLNVITYSLGTVPMNFQNTILVKGVVNSNVLPGANLLFRSDLSFLDQKSRVQTVSASLTAVTAGAAAVGNVDQGVALNGTASVFSSLFGFLTSGWFWFLLFLLLLALFILWLATRNRELVVAHE